MICTTESGYLGSTELATLRVLIGDDQPDVREALRLLLKNAGYAIEMVDSPHALISAVKSQAYDLILTDMNYTRDTTSGEEGLVLLRHLATCQPYVPVIVMTAWGSVDLAVEAMRLGASDFIQKPWDNARLLHTIQKQVVEASGRRQTERRVKSELEIARRVQQNLFPRPARDLAALEYAGRCVPASEIGGDYYDFLELGVGRHGFVLADVSGKGVAAALLMANLQATFRSHSALASRHTSSQLASINQLFYESTPAEEYATLFFAEYDEVSHILHYANCGHHAPVLLRRDGKIERLNATSTVLGMFPRWSAETAAVTLHSADTLVIFSDGVIEAGVQAGEEFGEERLISLIRAARNQKIESTVDWVLEAVHTYSMHEQSDDATVVAVRIR